MNSICPSVFFLLEELPAKATSSIFQGLKSELSMSFHGVFSLIVCCNSPTERLSLSNNWKCYHMAHDPVADHAYIKQRKLPNHTRKKYRCPSSPYPARSNIDALSPFWLVNGIISSPIFLFYCCFFSSFLWCILLLVHLSVKSKHSCLFSMHVQLILFSLVFL